jgi:hypothetical protein
MASYKKITSNTWDYTKWMPKCSSEGAFEVLFNNLDYQYQKGTYWILDGKCHRADGPAVEYANGERAWYLFGQRHWADGPAVEYADGERAWYLFGKRHREDGPAIEWANGHKEYYLYGEEYSEEEWEIEAMRLGIKNAII